MTHRGPFQPLLFCDSVIQAAHASLGLLHESIPMPGYEGLLPTAGGGH